MHYNNLIFSENNVASVQRFFSPDNFVQNPFFTQNYNRYSYCLNNPLKYKDSTGQWYDDDDYGDYDDRWDDDRGRPKRPISRDEFYDFLRDNMPGIFKDEYASGNDSNSSDRYGRKDADDPTNWSDLVSIPKTPTI